MTLKPPSVHLPERLFMLLHCLAGVVLSLLLWHTGLLTEIEYKTFDFRARHAASVSDVSSDIILVQLDQASLNWVADNLGVVWPWPRELYGAIARNCKRRGARVIGFDVLFTEPSPVGVTDDASLAAAIRENGPFALGSVFPSSVAAPHNTWPSDLPRIDFPAPPYPDSGFSLPEYSYATLPIKQIGSAATVLANVKQLPDQDGIYRRVHPFVLFDGTLLPNLGVGLYLAAEPDTEIIMGEKSVKLGAREIPVDEAGAAILRFRGPSGTYRSLNAAELLRQEFRLLNGELGTDAVSRDLQGKYVLFGFTAPGLYDLRPTPTDGVFSGVEINATILDNLLSGDFIRPVSGPVTVLILGGCTLASVFLVSSFSSFALKISTALILLPFPMILSWVAYRYGWDFTFVPTQISAGTGMALAILRAYFTTASKEKFIRHSFKHYLSPVVIEELIKDPERLQLGGERKELTLFFSDLQGFTSISEGLSPGELIELLNEYLTAMTDIILEEEGTVDKYVGDAIIAFWNAPLDMPDHAERAVRTALRCQHKLAEMRPRLLEKYGQELFMRIGINTGNAIVGNMGSSSRFDYTVLGDAVNLAARLEGANKFFGSMTMISAATRERLPGSFACRELGRIRVVGRSEPVHVAEPLSWNRVSSPDYSSFHKGLDLFYQGRFREAALVFATTSARDPVAAKYVSLCQKLATEKPSSWAGVYELGEK